jgi:hypothetical protein
MTDTRQRPRPDKPCHKQYDKKKYDKKYNKMYWMAPQPNGVSWLFTCNTA